MKSGLIPRRVALVALLFLGYGVAFLVLRPDRHRKTWEGGEIAGHLLAGEGYSLHRFSGFVQPTANQEPVYPLLLALFLAAAPAPYVLLVLFQVGAWLATAFLLARLARRMVGSSETWVGVLVAMWPPVAVYVLSYHPLWLRPSVGTLALAAAVFYRDRPSIRRSALVGAALGLAALTRATFLVLPLVILPWAFRPLHLDRARQLAVALATAALVLSPWVARNRLALGAWIPGTTTAGYIALMGNYRGASGSLDAEALRHVLSGLPPSFWSQSEPIRDAVFRSRVMVFWKTHPGEALWLYLKKLFYLWTWRPEVGSAYPAAWITAYCALWTLTLPLVLAGWWLARKDPRAEGADVFIALWSVLSLLYAFFAVNMRYRFETEPLLVPYAVIAVRAVIERLRRLCSGLTATAR